MKTNRSRLGLSILAGGLSFVGSANAVDLITNGSFETTGGWPYFSPYTYSSDVYFTGPPVPASENPGNTYGWRPATAFGDWDNFVTPTNETDHLQYNLAWAASQTVSLTNALPGAAIDAGLGQYTFSSWLASYGTPSSNPEQPYVVLRFFNDAANIQIGGNIIFDRTSNTRAVSYANGYPNNPPPADLSNDHDWVKYQASGSVPVGARKARVYLTRSPNAAKSFSPDTYMDLIKLDVINVNDTTILDSSSPANGATGVRPDVVISAVLRDIGTQVNTNTIQLAFDGSPVTAGSIQKAGTLTTVQYDPPGLLAPLSAHTLRIIWSDNAGPVNTRTNTIGFTVAPYVNIVPGAPLYQETFTNVVEGTLPAGWSVTNATDDDLPGPDLNNFHSESYKDWVVIDRDSTLTNVFNVIPGGSDYTSTTNVAPLQVLNGAIVSNLLTGHFILAASSSRFGNQVQYLQTGNYNLSGRANVYLLFNNSYVQNQDSIGAVEYSINNGATWLPARYMLDQPDIVLDSLGNVDGSNTMAAVHADVAPIPGNYGAFIGVAQNLWSTVGPYITARGNDDLVGSHRLEVIRLAQADNQPAVQFRFAQAANNSYYFGFDDFGLYSFTPSGPLVSVNPADVTVSVGNSATFTVGAIGVGPLSYQWRHAGTNLAGRTGQTLILPAVSFSAAGAYDVVVSNAGGSVTSSPTATLTVRNPAVFVTGEWDFINGDLAASYGTDLQYYDIGTQTNTSFGTTTSFGIPNINGQVTTVMKITPTSGNSGSPGANPSFDAWGGFKMFHGIAANGGGARVNQYTIIYDIYYPPASDHSWRALIRAGTSAFNGGPDCEFYINDAANGVGISSTYDGDITADTWHRIALAVDLTGPGPHPAVAKFVDGVKVGEQTGGLSGLDGRFSLPTSLALLFNENNAYNNDAYVSSIQISSGRRPDEFLAALGGPGALKIPGAIKATRSGTSVTINWSGGVPLQQADTLAGPWTNVPGLLPGAVSYTPSPLTAAKFYRPKIP